jgi:dynein heavy chain
LIEGLGSEKISWSKKEKEYTASVIMITGDVLLCSGIIAYMGPFFVNQRENCPNQWKKELELKNIEFT